MENERSDRTAPDAGISRAHRMFVETLPGRIASLNVCVKACLDAQPEAVPEQELEQAIRIAHQIAGTAGSFGYDPLTERARELERQLRFSPQGATTGAALDATCDLAEQIAGCETR